MREMDALAASRQRFTSRLTAGFFVRFHEVFFSGDSWRFNDADTLIRIYPERFWQDVSRLAAAIAVGQAIVLVPLSWWWLRSARRRLA